MERRIKLALVWRMARRKERGFLDDVLEKSKLDAGGCLVFELDEWNALLARWPDKKKSAGSET
jgi:hypothetical protein